MGMGEPAGAAAARLAVLVLACSAAASGAAMPDGATPEADRPRAASAASCGSRPDRAARRASAELLASLFAGEDRRSVSATASFTAAPASRGWKLSSVSRTGLLLFIAGKVPKCTAWAFAADPRPVRRCIKPSIEAAVSAGATIRTIRSAPGVSPFIAKMNARARQAPWSFLRTNGSSRASAASLSPAIPKDNARRRVTSSVGRKRRAVR